MLSRVPGTARLVGLGALFLVLSTGCEEPSVEVPPPPPVVVDASRSTVGVTPATGVVADGVAAAQVRVVLMDAEGKPVAGQAVRVETSGEAHLVQQPAAPTDAQGVATAWVRAVQPGVKTVQARVGTLTLAAQATVEFIAPPAAQLAFREVPASGTVGSPLAPALLVEVQDALGRKVVQDVEVQLSLAAGPADATLEGTLTARTVEGVARFGEVVLKKPGEGYALVARAEGLRPATSRTFSVQAGRAVSLALEGLSETARAGEAVPFTVVARDALGNVATGYTGKVRFTSNDAAAVLPADFTFTAQDAGRRSFSATLRSVGSRGVTVTDAANGTLTASGSVRVESGMAAGLVLTGLPSTLQAGTEVTLEVSMRDAFGNPATGYRGTVHFTTSDSLAMLPADYTFTAEDAGHKAFPLVLRSAGVHDVVVMDTANALGVRQATTVVAGPAASFALVGSTALTSGAPASLTLTVKDAFDNVATGYTGTVRWSATAGEALLPADYTFHAADAGRHTFALTLYAAGTATVKVEDVAAATLFATHEVTVAPAAAFRLEATAPTGPLAAGQPATLQVVAKDMAGNVATGYTGTLALSSSDAQAVLPADYTFSAADAGAHGFSVTLETAGMQSVTLTDVAQAGLTVTVPVDVVAGAAHALVFVGEPEGARVRTALSPLAVEVQDAYGNRATSASLPVTLSLQGGGSLLGTPTVTPVEGRANFSDVRVAEEGSGLVLEATAEGLPVVHTAPFAVVDDIAPAAPALQTGVVDADSIEVRWTAVGDDGNEGRAAGQSLRYATSPITDATWAQATEVTLAAPQAQGSAEAVVVEGLSSDTRYYFVLEVRDGAGNATRSQPLVVDTEAEAEAEAGACANITCTPPDSVCGEDGVSRTTYTSACVVVQGVGQCQDTPTTTACPGPAGVCVLSECLQAPAPAAGELRFTEVMHSPSVGTTGYVELLNTTDGYRNAAGLTLSFEAAGNVTPVTLAAARPLLVGPGQRLVLGAVADSAVNGGVPVDYAYGDALGLQGEGTLWLLAGNTLIDSLAYGQAFPQTTGRAMELASLVEGTSAGVRPWYWCESSAELAGGDRGTPGQPNGTCGMAVTAPVDWCAIQSPKTLSAPVAQGESTTVYGLAYEPDVTTRNTKGNDGFPFIEAELGWGADATNPAGWTWTVASPNPGYASPSSNNDEWQATLSIPTAGSYSYGFRFRMRASASSAWGEWTYCDQNGVAEPPAGTWGSVTVSQPGIANHVVISEFAVQGPAGASDEFVELYNPTGTEVDLSGWVLQYKSAAGPSYTGSFTLPANSKIAPHGYFLLASTAYAGAVAANATWPTSANVTLSNTAGHVRLGKPGITTAKSHALAVDTVGYGTTADSAEGSPTPSPNASPGSYERKALTTSTATTMAGGADAAKGNGVDTDNNAADFVLRTTREPQNKASTPEQL